MVSASSNPQMPRAFGLSALLHGGIIAVLVLMAWWAQRERDRNEDFFEVVAGPGDNYAATEAPTQAAPPVETVAVDLPPAPVIQPRPTPPVVQPRPPEPAPVTQQAPPRIEPRPAPVQEEPKPQTVSYQDFVRQNGAPQPRTQPAPAPIRAKEIDLGRVTAAATNNVQAGAGGTALRADTSDLERAYVTALIARIRRAMEAAGVTDVREAGVQFQVSLDGVISGARITQGSGSAEFDRAVLAAFSSIRPLGPPPTGKAEIYRTVIRLTEG